jgi:oligoribonuclease (3'-5' exoribonuclease)
VVEVYLENHSARVYNDNMPGFMDPMAMDYEVLDDASLREHCRRWAPTSHVQARRRAAPLGESSAK